MSLPASQYSVLDAERIERVDEKTFKCYVHRIKFFTFEVCPVLLVRVDEKPNGCAIRLLSCTVRLDPPQEQHRILSSHLASAEMDWAV